MASCFVCICCQFVYYDADGDDWVCHMLLPVATLWTIIYQSEVTILTEDIRNLGRYGHKSDPIWVKIDLTTPKGTKCLRVATLWHDFDMIEESLFVTLQAITHDKY